MTTQVRPRPLTSPGPKRSRAPYLLIGAAVMLAVGLLAVGTLPRVRRQTALAEGARQVRAAIPAVDVVTPRLAREGGLSLPSNIQAIKETVINARTTGYLRRLYVDIGSRVKAGQVLAEIESPDVDQQVDQALAQTAQSRATVGQSRAAVAQQRATVAQTRANVAQQRATVEQARAQLASTQSKAAQQQAAQRGAEAQLAHAEQQLDVQRASLNQAQAQLKLAAVTNQRYQLLVRQGAVAQQDADQRQATQETAAAAVASAEASVSAAQADVESARQAVTASEAVVASAEADVQASKKSVQASVATLASMEAMVRAADASVQASQANVQANQAAVASNQANARRYAVLRSFEKVVAPFDGVITSRNVDVGALINAGGSGSATNATPAASSGLLGIARADEVRVQVSVPQSFVPAVSAGSTAQVTVRELPGRTFTGRVGLRAGALDPISRTQLVEVHLPNRDHALVPGMYAQVRLTPAHPPATLRVPGSVLVIDAQGTRVASVTPEGRVHYLPVQVGTDFGTEVEIVRGLRGNERLVNNPSDTLAEGARVKAVAPPVAVREP
jgi:RND family efflux transporter MFP subunit